MAKKKWLWWALAGGVIAAIVALILVLGPRGSGDPPWPKVRFVDITDRSGVKFIHTSGATGRKLLPESMGSGVAVIDYDGDGRPDLLFINSCPWPGLAKDGPA